MDFSSNNPVLYTLVHQCSQDMRLAMDPFLAPVLIDGDPHIMKSGPTIDHLTVVPVPSESVELIAATRGHFDRANLSYWDGWHPFVLGYHFARVTQ